MLYALRFESVSNSLEQLLDKLKQRSNMSARQIAAIRTLVGYAGAKRRQHDLFGDQSAMEMTKRFIKGSFSKVCYVIYCLPSLFRFEGSRECFHSA